MGVRGREVGLLLSQCFQLARAGKRQSYRGTCSAPLLRACPSWHPPLSLCPLLVGLLSLTLLSDPSPGPKLPVLVQMECQTKGRGQGRGARWAGGGDKAPQCTVGVGQPLGPRQWGWPGLERASWPGLQGTAAVTLVRQTQLHT